MSPGNCQRNLPISDMLETCLPDFPLSSNLLFAWKFRNTPTLKDTVVHLGPYGLERIPREKTQDLNDNASANASVLDCIRVEWLRCTAYCLQGLEALLASPMTPQSDEVLE